MPPASRSNSHARRARIREMLAEHSNVSIQDLAPIFNVSEMTIRRDLEELERTGPVRRTHGGATASENIMFEIQLYRRQQYRREQKRSIAAEAIKLIKSGDRVMLDAGTTTLELALLLKSFESLTVITTSIAVASTLHATKGIKTYLLGGELREGRPDLTGGITEQTLELFTADVVFQGADGIDADGWVYNEDVQSALAGKKMRQMCRESYILADSSKIGRTALVRDINLKDGNGLITDNEISPEHLHALRETQGVKLFVAGSKKA